LRFGWRSAFLVTGGLGFLWLVLWWFVARPPLLASHRRTTLRVQWPNMLERRFWVVFSSFGLGAVALGVIAYLSPLYLNRALGLTQADLGRVLWIPSVGWQLGYFFWGWVADRYVIDRGSAARVFILLAALAAPVALVTTISSWAAVLGVFFWALFVADGFVVMSLRVGARIYPPNQTALVGGIGSGSWSAVLVLLLPVYGRFFDRHWYAAAFVSMSLLPIIGTALWLWLSSPAKLWQPQADAV
jgi:ACS family hexuronate transporter-like MFS transporter